jgi:hypothetical protein
MKRIFLVFIACTVFGFAEGQEMDMVIGKIECDRPDQNETPSLVPAGFFQLETGYYYEHVNVNEQNFIYPAALLKYGLGNMAELRVEFENTTRRLVDNGVVSYVTGISPVSIGAKVKICEERKSRPKTSVIISAGIPVLASKKLMDKYPSPEVRFTMQHSLSKRVVIGYNLGGLCRGEDFKAILLYTLTTSCTLVKGIDVYAELYGFVTYDEKQDHRLDGGFTYVPINNVMIDVSAGLNIEKTPGWFCGLGLSFRLPK